MDNDVNGFLFGGGVKAAKFEGLGDFVEGQVTDAVVSQQTSMEDNTPLFWPDGKPKMQLVITLQTEAHDDDEDNGLRRVFAKGGRYEVASGKGQSMKDAIADAVRRSGAKALEEGGKLKLGYTGEGKKTARGYSAPKLFTASYAVPVASVAVADLFDD
jgi:hypothetical protein